MLVTANTVYVLNNVHCKSSSMAASFLNITDGMIASYTSSNSSICKIKVVEPFCDIYYNNPFHSQGNAYFVKKIVMTVAKLISIVICGTILKSS